MNSYRVETNCTIYGLMIKNVSAYTAFDASEKATLGMPWRHKEDIEKQTVTILDGSKKLWVFEKEVL